ncbi:hypothetical protein STSP2_00388 [Anaerohalosphaera lusitana]|uniref:HTH cro/C1-type domain-containing protein n=1 Tax=Anaerohalosphaera lusitana TaxID=1936003 RepID=A0A1U9NHF9_9BACT|nr:helix-turn-helix transcriptional regulator [Anaerohalosphaera lusitana]AQT67245.1 hypothetical protein STSP2_00388 [Anaerohalosphaera lusitana]
MTRPFFDEFFADGDNRKIAEQEQLLMDVAGMLSELMGKKGVKNKELAETLNKKAPQVTQWLSGTCNMTLRTLSDILYALDTKLQVKPQPLIDEIVVDYKRSAAGNRAIDRYLCRKGDNFVVRFEGKDRTAGCWREQPMNVRKQTRLKAI